MLSEYRQRFSQFQTDLHREDYLFRSGRKTTCETAYIYSEYLDLFRLSAVEELRAKLSETAEYRETEVKSIRRLIVFALENHLAMRARDVSAEIERYEANAQITLGGEQISFRRSAELLANEADAKRRRDLYARRTDVIQGAQDLRAERFRILHAGAQELGFENYVTMRRDLRGVDCEKLVAQAEQILARTESRYVAALSSLLVREAGVSLEQAIAADLEWLGRYARFDAFFGKQQMPRLYRDLFAALGFNTERQSNVEIDSTPRPNKQPQAFCSQIEVPDEIKLVVSFTGGQANYRELLRTAGRAQHFAWTSHNLYPELRINGDAAISEAWSLLFENLLLEPAWLAGTFGFVENAEFRHALAVLRLMTVRRQAAKLIYEAEFHEGKLGHGAGPRYVELMTNAVRVRFDETEAYSDVSDDFYPASYIRATAFEVQMRDYLKTQFGSRWWASGKAGEMLIDVWNTG
ncbi:MAG: hypothetical protein M3X11_09820, partial [Acidobacteriota bacterium]|nr:hypothetical protein [Acidobacteriota bacterium]